MTAGRELDALVAEKVMGWACVHEVRVLSEEMIVADNRAAFREEYGVEPPIGYKGETDFGDYYPKWCAKCQSRDSSIHTQLPRYSKDMDAAWEVVDRMGLSGFTLRQEGIGWNVGFRLPGKGKAPYIDAEGQARADSAPLAICLAALAAVGAEVPA